MTEQPLRATQRSLRSDVRDHMPRVLNIRSHGIPQGAVYCGRKSPWGNPFKIGRDGDRDAVCDRFEREILPTLDVSMLAGKDLVCWYAPERCHCDAILRKANAYRENAAGPV